MADAVSTAAAAGRKIALFCFSVVMTTATGMCAPLSKNAEGQYDYQPSTAVFFAETLKLLIAFSMLIGESISRSVSKPDAEAAAKLPPLVASNPFAQIGFYMIPALLWFAGNNLTFITLQGISPAANQVIGQAKVAFTTVLLFFLLNRRFSLPQIISLIILLCTLVNMAISDSESLHKNDGKAGAGGNSTASVHTEYPVAPWIGVLCSLITAFTGSLAGVYNEKLLKELRSSIHFQNCLAYSWGMFFNLIFVFAQPKSRDAVLERGFLWGYNPFTWLYIVSVALMGLSVSFIFKFLDNIARIYALGVSTAVTVFLSWPAFGQEPTVPILSDVIIIFLALIVYYTTTPKDMAQPAKPDPPPKENTALLLEKDKP